MILVLEGSDGAGKSHLAAAIRDYWPDIGSPHDFQLIHTGPPDPYDRCVYQEYEQQLDEHAERVMSDGHLTVLDRWHAGDVIYAKYRPDHSPRFSLGGLLHTEMALSSFGAVKVVCSPPLEVVQKRVADRGDDYIDQEDLPRIHAAYLEHASKYGYTIIDTTHDIHGIISALLTVARRQARRARELAEASAGTYTGSLYPECIIAGDELGGNEEARQKRGDFIRPFTPNSPATSSEWLMSAIHKTGFLTTLGLVNVNHPGVDIAAIVKLRPNARWVALGSRASSNLNGHGIAHAVVHHPSFERRFRSSQHDDYAEQLWLAIRAC